MLVRKEVRKYSFALIAVYLVILVFLHRYSQIPLAITLCALFLLSYYFVIYKGLCVGGIQVKKDLLLNLSSILIVFIIFLTFIYALIARERFVYYWDYSGFWDLSIQESRAIFSEPLKMIPRLLLSIDIDEYNRFIPALMALPMQAMGESYISYILVIYGLFAFPAIVVIALSVKKYIMQLNITPQSFVGIVFLCGIMPCILIPVLNGYVDAAGLLTASTLIFIAIDFDWTHFSFLRNTVIGVLLLVTLFERRYFAFFVVGYIIGLCFHAFVCFLSNKMKRKTICKNFILTMSYIGVFCLTILLIWFRNFLYRGLGNNYSVAYSAYSTGDLQYKFFDIVNKIGPLFITIIIASIILVMLTRCQCASGTVFLLVSSISSLLLFFHIQNMDIHQLYIILSQITILLVGGLSRLCKLTKNIKSQKVIAIGLTIVFFCNFIYAYGGYKILTCTAFTNEVYSPRIRNDISQLKAIDQTLKSNLDTTQKVYVLSSSGVFNDDILRKLYFPSPFPEYLLESAHVDLRDGFPVNFLLADYLIVCSPVQYHLQPDSQKVVGVLSNLVMDPNSNIGCFYDKQETFFLENNVEAILYKKHSKLTKSAILFLQQLFDDYYPDQQELFKDRFVSYIEKYSII